MDVRIVPDDKQAAINNLIDDFLFAYRITKNIDQTKRVYYEALSDMLSLLEIDEIIELKKKILFNYDWMPKIKELKEAANRFIKAKSDIPEKEETTFEDVNYKELTLEEAKDEVTKILSPFFTDDSIRDVVHCFDLWFRGFTQEDFNFFGDKLLLASGEINTQRILDFFSRMRENRVEPRLRELRRSGKKLWQEEPPTEEVKKKHMEIRARFWGGKVPELVRK